MATTTDENTARFNAIIDLIQEISFTPNEYQPEENSFPLFESSPTEATKPKNKDTPSNTEAAIPTKKNKDTTNNTEATIPTKNSKGTQSNTEEVTEKQTKKNKDTTSNTKEVTEKQTKKNKDTQNNAKEEEEEVPVKQAKKIKSQNTQNNAKEETTITKPIPLDDNKNTFKVPEIQATKFITRLEQPTPKTRNTRVIPSAKYNYIPCTTPMSFLKGSTNKNNKVCWLCSKKDINMTVYHTLSNKNLSTLFSKLERNRIHREETTPITCLLCDRGSHVICDYLYRFIHDQPTTWNDLDVQVFDNVKKKIFADYVCPDCCAVYYWKNNIYTNGRDISYLFPLSYPVSEKGTQGKIKPGKYNNDIQTAITNYLNNANHLDRTVDELKRIHGETTKDQVTDEQVYEHIYYTIMNNFQENLNKEFRKDAPLNYKDADISEPREKDNRFYLSILRTIQEISAPKTEINKTLLPEPAFFAPDNLLNGCNLNQGFIHDLCNFIIGIPCDLILKRRKQRENEKRRPNQQKTTMGHYIKNTSEDILSPNNNMPLFPGLSDNTGKLCIVSTLQSLSTEAIKEAGIQHINTTYMITETPRPHSMNGHYYTLRLTQKQTRSTTVTNNLYLNSIPKADEILTLIEKDGPKAAMMKKQGEETNNTTITQFINNKDETETVNHTDEDEDANVSHTHSPVKSAGLFNMEYNTNEAFPIKYTPLFVHAKYNIEGITRYGCLSVLKNTTKGKISYSYDKAQESTKRRKTTKEQQQDEYYSRKLVTFNYTFTKFHLEDSSKRVIKDEVTIYSVILHRDPGFTPLEEKNINIPNKIKPEPETDETQTAPGTEDKTPKKKTKREEDKTPKKKTKKTKKEETTKEQPNSNTTTVDDSAMETVTVSRVVYSSEEE